jgi:tubby-related protein 1
MASKKRPKNKTSNYLITMDQNDMNRAGSSYLGKLRSNFVGTEFQVFDDGINPKDNKDEDEIRGSSKFDFSVFLFFVFNFRFPFLTSKDNAVRCEMGSVMYAANVLGSRGPRKMQVAVPRLEEDDSIMRWKDGNGPNGPGDDMLTRMKDRNFRDLSYLINKPPRWNEQVGAYVLNFNGRVTMASVKNFQLVDPEEQNAVVLQVN